MLKSDSWGIFGGAYDTDGCVMLLATGDLRTHALISMTSRTLTGGSS